MSNVRRASVPAANNSCGTRRGGLRTKTPSVNDLSKKLKNDPKGKRRLEFQSKIPPLKDKRFYLDLKGYKKITSLSARITELGGKVEEFLSKDITYLITNRKDANTRLSPRNNSTPSPGMSVPSPFPATKSSSIKGSNWSLPFSADSPQSIDTHQPNPKPATRASAIVNKATSRTSKSGTSDILTTARTWGVNVIHLDRVLEKLAEYGPSKAGNQPTIKELIGFGKKQLRVKVRKLQVPFIKVEDQSHSFKPLVKEFSQWPLPNFDSPVGSCPFDSMKNRKDVEPNNGNEKRKQQDVKKQPKKGYCECCCLHYDALDAHFKSNHHKSFAENSSNYESLDMLINQGPSLDVFLEKIKKKHSSIAEIGKKNSQDKDKENYVFQTPTKNRISSLSGVCKNVSPKSNKANETGSNSSDNQELIDRESRKSMTGKAKDHSLSNESFPKKSSDNHCIQNTLDCKPQLREDPESDNLESLGNRRVTRSQSLPCQLVLGDVHEGLLKTETSNKDLDHAEAGNKSHEAAYQSNENYGEQCKTVKENSNVEQGEQRESKCHELLEFLQNEKKGNGTTQSGSTGSQEIFTGLRDRQTKRASTREAKNKSDSTESLANPDILNKYPIREAQQNKDYSSSSTASLSDVSAQVGDDQDSDADESSNCHQTSSDVISDSIERVLVRTYKVQLKTSPKKAPDSSQSIQRKKQGGQDPTQCFRPIPLDITSPQSGPSRNMTVPVSRGCLLQDDCEVLDYGYSVMVEVKSSPSKKCGSGLSSVERALPGNVSNRDDSSFESIKRESKISDNSKNNFVLDKDKHGDSESSDEKEHSQTSSSSTSLSPHIEEEPTVESAEDDHATCSTLFDSDDDDDKSFEGFDVPHFDGSLASEPELSYRIKEIVNYFTSSQDSTLVDENDGTFEGDTTSGLLKKEKHRVKVPRGIKIILSSKADNGDESCDYYSSSSSHSSSSVTDDYSPGSSSETDDGDDSVFEEDDADDSCSTVADSTEGDEDVLLLTSPLRIDFVSKRKSWNLYDNVIDEMPTKKRKTVTEDSVGEESSTDPSSADTPSVGGSEEEELQRPTTRACSRKLPANKLSDSKLTNSEESDHSPRRVTRNQETATNSAISRDQKRNSSKGENTRISQRNTKQKPTTSQSTKSHSGAQDIPQSTSLTEDQDSASFDNSSFFANMSPELLRSLEVHMTIEERVKLRTRFKLNSVERDENQTRYAVTSTGRVPHGRASSRKEQINQTKEGRSKREKSKSCSASASATDTSSRDSITHERDTSKAEGSRRLRLRSYVNPCEESASREQIIPLQKKRFCNVVSPRDISHKASWIFDPGNFSTSTPQTKARKGASAKPRTRSRDQGFEHEVKTTRKLRNTSKCLTAGDSYEFVNEDVYAFDD